jgi:hypothetical protein
LLIVLSADGLIERNFSALPVGNELTFPLPPLSGVLLGQSIVAGRIGANHGFDTTILPVPR